MPRQSTPFVALGTAVMLACASFPAAEAHPGHGGFQGHAHPTFDRGPFDRGPFDRGPFDHDALGRHADGSAVTIAAARCGAGVGVGVSVGMMVSQKAAAGSAHPPDATPRIVSIPNMARRSAPRWIV